MYDDIAVLKEYTTTSRDKYGNAIKTLVTSQIYVQPRGVYSSEFYNAAQNGLKPSITLYIANKTDYHGEKIIEFQNVDYDVIRVDWSAQRDGISLICEERAGNNQ